MGEVVNELENIIMSNNSVLQIALIIFIRGTEIQFSQQKAAWHLYRQALTPLPSETIHKCL